MSDRWRLLEDLSHRARDLSAVERAVFLNHACSGDLALRAEIDAFLAEGSGPGSSMRRPAIEGPARSLAVTGPLVRGRQVGPFPLLEPAGKGASRLRHNRSQRPAASPAR